MGYNLKLEKELVKLGFKKKYLFDKSGYWMEKSIKPLGLKGKITVESDNNLVLVDIQTYEYFEHKLNKGNMETITKIKCDLTSIKQAIKKYGK